MEETSLYHCFFHLFDITCSSNQFKYGNRNCVYKGYICNGDDYCGDNTDERCGGNYDSYK